ncbi:hypothetical protein ZWY2020_009587 [Hordeum vulgare]|nr:hypothetical protein ZWY2020_009587 [Hordeum vulgare]
MRSGEAHSPPPPPHLTPVSSDQPPPATSPLPFSEGKGREDKRESEKGFIGVCQCGDTGHSNGSQIFITLDRCDWLDKKNTIFGKVTGDSIFNLLALVDIETDKDDRPVYP